MARASLLCFLYFLYQEDHDINSWIDPLSVEKQIHRSIRSRRYIILNGTIVSTQINLISICSSWWWSLYLSTLLCMLIILPWSMIGSDFNDRSTTSTLPTNKQEKQTRGWEKFMANLNLISIWRHINPHKKRLFVLFK